MNEKLNLTVKMNSGCCKTVSTVINEDKDPEIATIDMGSGKITYGPNNPQEEEKLKQAKEKIKNK
ncbi:hypothetical protein [Desulfovibrio litoralis]|uniref:HMA domain-containing protein n=1 Tax=Desulfovibrio litoralis DSM 11393 TaxID=1121455 RepID=A0A1M7SAL2_9BACT|nr:hypothetical protein [Desulfovibrio litoralis]SHN55292.1 hypothetical protein SAMN02745728_00654 [Desulfovibrio litoralis DSM 11393]